MSTTRFQFSRNAMFPEVFRLTHPLAREFMSEFASTFLFLLAGVGCVMQIKTGSGQFGTFLSLNIGWGLAVAMGCGLGIGVSGGHMNPAVTFAQFLLGRKTFLQFLVYLPAQVMGAFFGTAVAYWDYMRALDGYDGGHRVADGPTGSLCFLVTCPASFQNKGDGILDQVIGTGILVATMCSVIDSRNEVPKFLHPLFGGLSVIMIGICYGVSDGYPINPARDIGARLFAAIIYGSDAFSANNYWFWVPIVGPMLGSLAGAIFYNFLFDFHAPQPETSIDDPDNHFTNNKQELY